MLNGDGNAGEWWKTTIGLIKAWFSYVGRISDNRGFYFLPTVQDISDKRHNSVSDSPDEFGRKWKCAKTWNLRDKGPGAQQFMGLVMSEIHRRCPLRYSQIFRFSFVGNDHRPSQKSGTR